jgi:uncharacterized protein
LVRPGAPPDADSGLPARTLPSLHLKVLAEPMSIAVNCGPGQVEAFVGLALACRQPPFGVVQGLIDRQFERPPQHFAVGFAQAGLVDPAVDNNPDRAICVLVSGQATVRRQATQVLDRSLYGLLPSLPQGESHGSSTWKWAAGGEVLTALCYPAFETMTRKSLLATALAALAAATFVFTGAAADPPAFTTREVMISMRDGCQLHTEINTPKDARGPLPVLMVRTPYGAAGQSRSLLNGGAYRELARDGYIFVFQDIRGRYGSEGRFVMMRPPRDSRDPASVDEATDAYDTVDWLIRNVPGNNGRAGIFGISYPGWLTVMAMLEPHSALKAVSEQAAICDMFLGDDFHHNGAFRLSYGFEYPPSLEMNKEGYSFPFNRWDLFEWYLSLVPLSSATKNHFGGKVPTWKNFIEHPNYDDFWKAQAAWRYLDKVTVPNLNVAGWWDQEDFYGPLKTYQTLEEHDSSNLNYFVAGPWNHGGWARGEGRQLGAFDFGSDTSVHFRGTIEAPWFAYWLKGEGDGKFPEARTFQTGSNTWTDQEEWPPRRGFSDQKLYLDTNGRAGFRQPRAADDAFDSYVSDPRNPVPYRKRPIGETYGRPGWATWLLEDQRFVDRRPDVLSWETEALGEDVTVTGDITARLFASTSGTDSDWVVKLIDRYPDDYRADAALSGYQLIVASEVFRGRFRRSFEKPEPIRPGEVNEYAIDLHWNNHVFLKGHRFMVQVQSTWFPLIDRNPQKFVPNIFEAQAENYQKAEQRVYRSKRYPSHIVLHVQQKP